MGISDQRKQKKNRRYHVRIAVQIFVIAFSLSVLMSFASQSILARSSLLISLIVLLIIIAIGIVFDIVGVAVATADPAPFHAMAAKKNQHAQTALKLINNASMVATFSNDVVGDIAGIISGAAVASIVFRIDLSQFGLASGLLNVLLSGLAAGLTVGGKAIGKEFALTESKKICYVVAVIINRLRGNRK